MDLWISSSLAQDTAFPERPDIRREFPWKRSNGIASVQLDQEWMLSGLLGSIELKRAIRLVLPALAIVAPN